jgi:hypothetical protein
MLKKTIDMKYIETKCFLLFDQSKKLNKVNFFLTIIK